MIVNLINNKTLLHWFLDDGSTSFRRFESNTKQVRLVLCSESFEKHQQELRNLRIQSEDLIQNKQIIASPANDKIVYSLDDAFDVILLHEQRHFIQSKAVLALLGKTIL